MAEATSAFATAREAVQAIGARLAALGPGVDAELSALAARLGTLPAAARFAPFGGLGALAQASVGGSAQASNGAANKRGGGPRPTSAKPAAAGKTMRTTARAGASARNFNPAQRLVATLAGGAGAGRTSEPDLAGKLIVEPVLETIATLARLTRKPPVPTASADVSLLAAPAAIAQHVAQWMAERLEQAATPSPAPGSAPFGADIADLLERSLAGLGKPARRGAKPLSGKPKAKDATARTAPPQAAQPADPGMRTSAAEPAPRAPSKLLPPGAATSSPEAAAADRPEAPTSSSGIDDDPIDAMTRALVDQAWLRGVDLR